MARESRSGSERRLPILDFDESSAAISNVGHDDGTPEEHDGRAKTQTKFNPEEAPAHRRDKFETLAKLNDNTYGSNTDTHRQSQRRRDCQTIANQLDCTDHQTSRALTLLESIDFEALGSIGTEAAVLACITIACNEDDRPIRNGTLADGDIAERYRDIRDSYDVDERAVRHVRRHCHEHHI